jgi:hypothetical protein
MFHRLSFGIQMREIFRGLGHRICAMRSLSFSVLLLVLSNPLSLFAVSWPLGILATNGTSDASCPAGYLSRGYAVHCPGVSNDISGFLAIRPATKSRGLLVAFTGSDGMNYWTSQGTPVYDFAEELRALGFTIVQVKWNTSWLESSPGNDAGPAHLGCRPATVIKYIYDMYYEPLGIPKQRFRAGFVLTGNSGGASQVGYALSHYGLEEIVDVAIPTGGPPHSALAKSCMNTPGEQAYWFALTTREFIDRGYGFFDGNGPAARQDSSFIPRWREESVSTGGNDYFYANTRVHFIQGSEDLGMQAIGADFYIRLLTERSPSVMWEIAPNTPHAVHSTAEGRAAIKAAILGPGLTLLPQGGNQFQLSLNGSSNLNYILEASTTFAAWDMIRSNRGSFTFTTNFTGAATRFYRVLVAP